MKDDNEISFEMAELPSCPGKLEVPTPKEKEALDKMRNIKDQARKLKSRLAELEDSDDEKGSREIAELRKGLSDLKVSWDKWEQMRQEAAKERMIILGHEERE